MIIHCVKPVKITKLSSQVQINRIDFNTNHYQQICCSNCPVVRWLRIIFFLKKITNSFHFTKYSGKSLRVLFLLFIMDSVRGFTQSNCPLLRTYRDNSGLLAVNKTVIVNNELPVHCQWLIASSFQQVIKSNLWIDKKLTMRLFFYFI